MYNEPAKLGAMQTIPAPDMTLVGKLQRQKELYEQQLEAINKSLKALEENPELAQILDTINSIHINY